MENGVVKLFACAALGRLKAFANRIREALSSRSLKRINKFVEEGLKTESVDATIDAYFSGISEILRCVKQSNYLTDRLISYAEIEFLTGVLERSLEHELQGDRYFYGFKKYLAFSNGQKEELVDKILSETDSWKAFACVRGLLKYAGVLPYSCQEKLFRRYLDLFPDSSLTLPEAIGRKKAGEFVPKQMVGSADLIYAYDAWRGLDKNFKKELRDLMVMALQRSVMQRRKVKDGAAEVIYSDEKNQPTQSDTNKN